ncbi:MAG: hypothetical protein AB7N71_07770 [Phycisphaerae bacterium]
MLDLPDTLGKELLEKQGIDTRKIRPELHAMRTGDAENAARIQGYVTALYSRPFGRFFERRARVREVRPTDPVFLINNLTEYAATRGLQQLTVTSKNFKDCLPPELASRRGFRARLQF